MEKMITATNTDDHGGIGLVETVESNPIGEGSGDGMHRPIVVDFVYELPPFGEPTLRLALKNVAVLDVQGVRYD